MDAAAGEHLPVREEDGTLVSYVHVKDLLGIAAEHRDEPVPPQLLHELITVPVDATHGVSEWLLPIARTGAGYLSVSRRISCRSSTRFGFTSTCGAMIQAADESGSTASASTPPPTER